jgi:hypothetical protein
MRQTEYRNIKIAGKHVTGESKYGSGWVKFSGCLPLMRIAHCFYNANAYTSNRIWSAQDGYGTPGFVPGQGYDWSGIRDSSVGAIAVMDAIAIEWNHGRPWPWEV